MFATPFISFHVIVSFVAIASGFAVLAGFLGGRQGGPWTPLFLVTAAIVLISGFLLPFSTITPAVATGIVGTVVLLATLYARYAGGMRGVWRPVFVVGAVVSLYLNVFVLVAQLFLKVPTLNALAPTGSEPPFAIAQGIVLALFLVAGTLSLRRFHPAV
jgi:hypothetical protein